MDNLETGSLESRKDFKNTPEDQFTYWNTELGSAEKRTRVWRKQGTKIVEKFLGGKEKEVNTNSKDNFRLNLFHSNTATLKSMLYGNLPKVDVKRRFNDPDDDEGRVAALIMERLLNNDIQDNGKEYNSVLKACLEDRLLPGLGCARVRYTSEFKDVPVMDELGQPSFDEEGKPKTQEELVKEDAPIDYYHWRDVRWGWSRTFSEIPWIAFRSHMDKDEATKRFGKDHADDLEYKDQSVVEDKDDESTKDEGGPWKKAEIWEIWDKAKKKVVWISTGYEKVLDTKDDFLKLSGFFPCPPFLLANSTTSLYQPVSDFHMAQDLYNEIDTLQTRISIITEAVKVVGVYDTSAEGLKRMFKEGMDNELIPVENWALFAEKGGIAGQIDWLPLADIVGALQGLREIRDETIGLLQQVTGMSDVMRGELSSPYEGVGQTQQKAKFGSIRVQALQEEFATFASDLLQLKAEVIGRHFSPETIYQLANLEKTYDAQLALPAIQLVKEVDSAKLRVLIRPESVAMVDYAQLKDERVGYLTAIATFMQSAAPLIEMEPSSKPYLLQMLQWGLAGFKGANQIEGVLDKAIQAAEEAAKNQQEKPDPDKQKMDMAMQLEQTKHKNAMEQINAKAAVDGQVRQQDLQADLQKIQAELMSDLKEIQAKAMTDMRVELSTSETNAEQQTVAVRNEIEKMMVEHGINMKEIAAQAAVKQREIAATAAAKPAPSTGDSDG